MTRIVGMTDYESILHRLGWLTLSIYKLQYVPAHAIFPGRALQNQDLRNVIIGLL